MARKKTKVVCYCRVSTQSDEQLMSFENQQRFFEDYIARHPEYSLYKSKECPTGIYADRGVSGTLLHREQFDLMLKHAGLLATSTTYTEVPKRVGEGEEALIKYRDYNFVFSKELPKFTKILVRNTSRFSRNIQVIEVLRKLREIGVYVQFLDIDKSTEYEGDFTVISLFQTFDEMFSRDLSRKLLSANELSRKNQILRTNPDLYGYEYHKRKNTSENNHLTIKEEEAYYVRMLFRLYLGCYVIDANDLNPEHVEPMQPCDFDCQNCKIYNEDLTTESGIGFRKIMVVFNDIVGFRTRKGKPIALSTIKHIFENEKYFGGLNTGKWDHGPLFNRYSTPQIRQGFQVIERPDIIPPIISKQLFDLCTAKRGVKVDLYHAYGGCGGHPSEYRGKFICGLCGGAMTHNINKAGSGYYNCRIKKTKGTHHCTNGNIYESQIKQYLNEYCAGGLEYVLQQNYQRVISTLYTKIEEIIKQLETANAEKIEELRKGIDDHNITLENLYIKQANPSTSTAAIERAIAKQEKELEELSAEYAKLIRKPENLIKECQEFFELATQALTESENLKKKYTEEELWQYVDVFKVYSKVKKAESGQNLAPETYIVPVFKNERAITEKYGIDFVESFYAHNFTDLGIEGKNFQGQAKIALDTLYSQFLEAEKPYISGTD